MSKQQTDLIICQKQQGVTVGKLCDKCDGKCVSCDSYVNLKTTAKICDNCKFGNYINSCLLCGYNNAINTAYFCNSCTLLEKDRDGCPKVINLSMSKKDYIFNKKSIAFNNLDKLNEKFNS